MALYASFGGEFIRRNYRTFEGREIIYREAELEGIQYSFKGDSLSMYASRISHNFSARTGSLKWVLWACEKLVLNGIWEGHKLGKARLDPLEVGKSYIDIKRKVPLTRPPTGSYFLVMEL
jgi:hypothetical protein